MNTGSYFENKLALINLLGLSESEADSKLKKSILITYSIESKFNIHLKNILERTYNQVDLIYNSKIDYACEIIIGSSKSQSSGPFVHTGIGNNNTELICTSQNIKLNNFSADVHEIFLIILGCYTVGITSSIVFGVKQKFNISDTIVLDINKIITNNDIFNNVIDIKKCVLAGAGAVGNSFLYSLRTFSVKGEIVVCDPDVVDERNLNRCLFFEEEDDKKNKAEVIVTKCQKLLPNINFLPFSSEVANLKHYNRNFNKIECLIVGVDSRRARRNLQMEIAKEVYDASTTDLREIVLHHHSHPLNGLACLGCIYFKEDMEDAHEKHVADHLGILVEEVKKQFINETSAIKISKKHNLEEKSLIGIPYDTLFKQLCGQGQLHNIENKQVIAPLAFVSVLAGAFLALRFLEGRSGIHNYNYWRLSPWMNPNFRLQSNLYTNSKCKFCNDPIYQKAAENIWNN